MNRLVRILLIWKRPERKHSLALALFLFLFLPLSVTAAPAVDRDIETWQMLRDDDRADTVSFARFKDFIDRNHDWPQMTGIQRRFEQRLAKTGRYSVDAMILYFGQHPPLTASGWEVYLQALTRKGQRQRGAVLFREWWVDAIIPVADQIRLAERYKDMLSAADHRKRLDRIVYDKQYSAARSLADRLGGGYRQLVEARIALRNEKRNVQRAVNQVPAGLTNSNGLIYDRIVWRRRNENIKGAIELLMNSPKIEDEGIAKLWWRQRHILARDMIEEGRYVEAYDLLNQHKQVSALGFSQAEWLKGWLELRFLGRPHQAFQSFERMYNAVTTPISRARGSYWAGRAAERLGQSDVANLWYQTAAQYPTTFYGQSAAVRAGIKNALNPVALGNATMNAEGRNAKIPLYRDDRVQAAMALNRAGEREDAALFLRRVLYDIDNANQLHFFAPLAELAVQMSQPEVAIRVTKKAERHRLFLSESAYPSLMHKIRRSNPLDPAMVHAIIRQESRFDALAKSPAGALGLMQLMPATAQETASKLGIQHRRAWLTDRPEHNIILGSEYLSRMLDRYDGSLPLAIAAYNAGPGRVNSWINRFGDPRTSAIEMLDWMELIPIYETRNYVQRVLEAYAVYTVKLPKRSHDTGRNGRRYNQ